MWPLCVRGDVSDLLPPTAFTVVPVPKFMLPIVDLAQTSEADPLRVKSRVVASESGVITHSNIRQRSHVLPPQFTNSAKIKNRGRHSNVE